MITRDALKEKILEHLRDFTGSLPGQDERHTVDCAERILDDVMPVEEGPMLAAVAGVLIELGIFDVKLARTPDGELCIQLPSPDGVLNIMIDEMVSLSFIAYREVNKKDILRHYPVPFDPTDLKEDLEPFKHRRREPVPVTKFKEKLLEGVKKLNIMSNAQVITHDSEIYIAHKEMIDFVRAFYDYNPVDFKNSDIDTFIERAKQQWIKDYGHIREERKWDGYILVGFLTNVQNEIDV